MAFGFFKKKNLADSILFGGRLLVSDPDLEGADAVAVKDGRIMAIDEYQALSALKGPDTRLYDLQGKWLCPGLIDAFGCPADHMLKGYVLKLDGSEDADLVLDKIRNFIESNPQAPFCLAEGASLKLFSQLEKSEDTGLEEKDQANDDLPEDSRSAFTKALDDVSGSVPVIMLGEDGLNMRLNTAASDPVKESAAALDSAAVTPELALDAVLSADYSGIMKNMAYTAYDYASRGFTSVFGSSTSIYKDKIYRDLLTELFESDMIKQRFYSSMCLTRTLDPASVIYTLEKFKTLSLELDNKINYDTLVINASSSKDDYNYMPGEYLEMLLPAAADKGYNIRLCPSDKTAALTGCEIMGRLSSAYSRLSFVLDYAQELSPEDTANIYTGAVRIVCRGRLLPGDDSLSPAEVLSSQAASIINASGFTGSLAEGLAADFAVFDEDCTLFTGARAPEAGSAAMCFVAGEKVYDRSEDTPLLWAQKAAELLEPAAFDEIGDY